MTTRTTRTNSRPHTTTHEPVTPTTEYVQQGVPKREKRTSAATGQPIPRKWLPMELALVGEQWRIGVRRMASRYSNLEAVITSKGIVGAEEIRDKGVEKLGEVIEQVETLRVELKALHTEIDEMSADPVVVDARGGLLTTTQAKDRMTTVADVVRTETDDGSLKHRRVPRWLMRITPYVPVVDGPVMLWFVSQIFNVDWTNPSQSIMPLLISAVFSILATVAIALGLHFFGRDSKGFKDHTGHISLPKGPAKTVPLTFLVLSIVVTIGSGVVMAFRIVSDSLSAGNGGLAGAILGLFFAAIVIALNVVIFAVNYRDGSTQTDELDHYAKQLLTVRSTERQLQKKSDTLTARLNTLQSKGIRIYEATLAKMSEPLTAANQLILQARSYHQGCGAEVELVPSDGEPQYGVLLPTVSVDTSVLDNLRKRLNQVEDVTDTVKKQAVSA